ncbi:desmoglein-2 [Tiliqua scincoides]|uniref:desmoglein-2 n=1 Tax=Tiliqua scincoides TaxID=71010 RepID=UPI0034627A03
MGAGGLRLLLLLWSCIMFGHGLHVEVLGGRNDQPFRMNSLIRQKREWIAPPASITEESDNSYKNPIVKIRSDRDGEKGLIITYSITGPGATEPPVGLFVIDQRTGAVNVTGIVDREQIPMFNLKGYARNQFGNFVEKPIDLRIKVDDVNDNLPVFSEQHFVGSVEELCEVGTFVMQISATDADEPNHPNSQIAYRIISQNPSYPEAFVIEAATGRVTTQMFQLDREEQSSYSLTVEAKDRNGEAIGRGQETTVQINILDVNDNIPVLEKVMYEGSVQENTANVEVLRLKAFDRDEQYTDNWLAQFVIESGNEGGYFQIVTDSQTNEGVLTLVKEINYEELQSMDLNIVVSNKAAYHKSIISQGYKAKPVPVKVKVVNVKEGPQFKPSTMVIQVNETMKVNQVIGRYQAIDEDTGKTAQGIRYVKSHDSGNWLTIDSRTAEIKLIKVPDYESSFVVNGTYTAMILAITGDSPSKTVTGTIAIQVENVNDHCPTVTPTTTRVCSDAQFIDFTIEDRDSHPNGGPFTVTVIDHPERMSDKWVISRIDGSRAQIIPQNVNPGRYKIPVLVKDSQGLSCPEQQFLSVDICHCEGGGGCQERIVGSSVVLGPAAIALIILALLLLLLVPLLLLACGFGSGATKSFAAIPDNSEEMLRNWNSEGAAPEDKAILIRPSALESSASHMGSGGAAVGVGATGAAGGGSSSAFREHQEKIQTAEERWEEQQTLLSREDYRGMATGGRHVVGAGGGLAVGAGGTMTMEAGGVVNEEFLRSYFSDKAEAFAEEDEAHLAKDCLLVYSQEEERDSPHGSVGCCSFIEGDFDDHFLDDLGDKFKTLAEICTGRHISLETNLHSNQGLKNTSPSSAANESDLRYLHQQNTLNSKHTYTSDSSYKVPEPTKGFGSEAVMEEVVTTTSLTSRPDVQPVRPIPDPIVSSNVVVTETSYGAIPPTVILDPQFKENVVVTERVLAPSSNLQNVFEMPPGIFPDLPDSKYVVVRERERVLVPSSDAQTSLSIPSFSEGQNVVVTERVVTPTPGLLSMTEPTTYSGSDVQERILISDPLFNQTNAQEVFPSGSTLNKSSRVTKYSSVQYTRS